MILVSKSIYLSWEIQWCIYENTNITHSYKHRDFKIFAPFNSTARVDTLDTKIISLGLIDPIQTQVRQSENPSGCNGQFPDSLSALGENVVGQFIGSSTNIYCLV